MSTRVLQMLTLGRSFGRLASHFKCQLSTVMPSSSSDESAVHRFICDKIRVSGPITVAEYMKLCVSSKYGYYSRKKEIFGEKGDFITSPELTQIFGELVGAWVLNEIHMTGWTNQWQLVELGPGTGTLMADILRVFQKLQSDSKLSVHFVENSPQLAEQQRCRFDQQSKQIPFHWYQSIEDVPDDKFSVFVSNEFFDALPIHQFVRDAKDPGLWHEVYVTLDADRNLCFVHSPGETICSQAFIPEHIRRDHSRTQWECSPAARQITLEMVKRFTANGGFALIIDYGHNGDRQTHSLRAYRGHAQVSTLDTPGQADLTADVDFGELARAVQGKCLVYGPVEQRRFLAELGLAHRLDYLLAKCKTQEEKEALLKGSQMLVSDDQMGTRFKAFSLFPSTLAEIIEFRGAVPAGFASTLPWKEEQQTDH